jgi:hypothetical protein
MKYGLLIFLIMGSLLGFGQKTNKTFINSEWWLVHGPACINFSYLKYNNNFTLCIHKPSEKLILKGNIVNHGDTLLIKTNDFSDYINGFLIQGNNVIVLPALASYISSKGFRIPDNILIDKQTHLANLDKRKKRTILKKKIRTC